MTQLLLLFGVAVLVALNGVFVAADRGRQQNRQRLSVGLQRFGCLALAGESDCVKAASSKVSIRPAACERT